jgi:hypothetical protein
MFRALRTVQQRPTDLRRTSLQVTLLRSLFLDLQHICPQLTLIVHHRRLYTFGVVASTFSRILHVSHEP